MSRTIIKARLDRNCEKWEIECVPRTETDTASIVTAIKYGRTNGLIDKIKEALIVEPIKWGWAYILALFRQYFGL